MKNDARLDISGHEFTGWAATAMVIGFLFLLWASGFLAGFLLTAH
jgi:hypothetical protein